MPKFAPEKRERECKYCSFRAICDSESLSPDEEDACDASSAAKARNNYDIAGSFTAEDTAQAPPVAQAGGDE